MYTQESWKHKLVNGQYIIYVSGKPVAQVFSQTEYRARLIAAAPDLLEACEAGADELSAFVENFPESASAPLAQKALRKLLAAIAKAKS